MPEANPSLAAALKQAKTKAMFFAFVAKGNEGKLLVDKKKINSRDTSEAKKECGGGTVYKGRCKGEEGLMVFEVGRAVSPSLMALTKKIIKQDAGLTFEVEYRVATDLAAEESSGESPSEGGNPTAEVAPPPPQPVQGGAEVIKQLNAMAGDIKAAMAGPSKARVQTLFVSVNGLIKNKDFAQAGKVLDELKPLVAPSTSPSAPPRGETDAPDDLGAEVKKRLAEWTPAIKAALTAKGPNAAAIAKLVAQVTALSKPGGDIVQALAKLNECHALAASAPTAAAGVPPAPPADAVDADGTVAAIQPQPPESGAGDAISLVKLGKARLEWDGARAHAVQEIQRLKEILREEHGADQKVQSALSKAQQRLDSMIASMNEELGDQLDNVLNSDRTQRSNQAMAAQAVLKRFVNLVDSDEILSAIDGNEYARDMEVAGPLRAKLQNIATALS